MSGTWRAVCTMVAVLGAGCHESRHGSAAKPSDGATPGASSVDAPLVSATAARPLPTITVTATEIQVDGEVVDEVRPSDAPGIVDEDLAATYVYPRLRQRSSALQTTPLVRMDPQTTVGALRGVAASMPPAVGGLSLQVGDGPARSLITTPPTPPRIRIRPRAGAIEILVDGTLAVEVDDPSTLSAAVTALDASLRDDGLGLDWSDDAPLRGFDDVLATTASVGRAVLLTPRAPCVGPPPGMVCVPGGPAVVGYDDGPSEETPAREIELSTFYIDTHEVTNAEYDRCHDAGACPVRINRHQAIMKPFVGPDQPAMPMDWRRARTYCAWAGKQLPTEWQWEKAARGPDGDLYPWGNEPPTCDKATFRECAPHGCTPFPGKQHPWDCNEHVTKPVGSHPAGHYGISDMAGNGYEWTRSAAAASIAECGAACGGDDPLGPCDGAFPCQGERVLRGGSWYWPKHRVRGSHRRMENVSSGSHRLGMRCATDRPFLTVFPPRHVTTDRPPPQPEPPGDQARRIFAEIAEDPIEDKPLCDTATREAWGSEQLEGGRSTPKCRDPFPYLMSNEPRGYVWADYIANLGGAYVGIGSDQNYSYIAKARAQWAWVVDYDPRVYRHHLRLRALVLAAPTPAEFIELFEEDREQDAMEILEQTYRDTPEADVARLRYGFRQTRAELLPYFRGQTRRLPDGRDFGWLRNEEHYRYIRTLLQQGRLRPVRGDLLAADGALASIAAAARSLDVPVRIYYTSNAPSSWGGEITEAYRANVRALPFDAWSIVLQTNSRGGFAQAGKWHHSITWGLEHQRRLALPGYDTIPKLLEDRIPGDDGDLTLIGLPSDATAPVSGEAGR